MSYLVQGGVTPDNSVTLAKLAPGTDGNIISFDADGNPVAVATGSDGEVLTSAGAGQPPAFEAASSGAFEFVSTAALTTATSVEVNNFVAGYDYIVVFENIGLTTDNQQLWCRFSDDAGSSFESGSDDYEWAMQLDGSRYAVTGDCEIKITSSHGNDSNFQGSIEITFINPNDSSEKTMCIWHGFYMSDDVAGKAVQGGGSFKQGTDAVEDVQFLWSGGSTFKAQGDITVWRRKRS